jgi:hypothetical protein
MARSLQTEAGMRLQDGGFRGLRGIARGGAQKRSDITVAGALTAALIALAAGCGGGGGGGGGGDGGGTGGGGGGGMATMGMAASADTFINSGNPNNNNGASTSLSVGVDEGGGVMRALVRFDIPAAMAGAAVSSVSLALTMRASSGFVYLHVKAVNESWTEGNGSGDALMMSTVGQACGGTVSGATWNQPSCTGGTATPWATPGGSVATTSSGQHDSNTGGVDIPVSLSSSDQINAGLVADVQRWIDDPSSNHGWRISAALETGTWSQTFYSREADGTKGPKLTVTYLPAP